MSESGSSTKPMEKEYSTTLTETYTRENGLMTRPMGRGHTLTPTGLSMWESGRTISRMEWEWRSGLMERDMKENIKMAPKQVKEYLNFLMAATMKVSFSTIKFTVKVHFILPRRLCMVQEQEVRRRVVE